MAWYKCVIQKSASPDALIDRSITSVNSGVTEIGQYAFYGCTSLTSATFPNATSVQTNAFNGCNHLTSISLPEVVNLYSNAFVGASSLTSISLPKCIQILLSVFNGCASLASVSAPEVISISSNAFQNSGITRINFPKATTINGAFYDAKSLVAVDFDNELPKIKTVGTTTFSGCTSLSQIISATNITSVGSNAFRSCPITNSSMSKFTNVTDISSGAFSYMNGCTEVNLPNLLTLGSSAFSYSTVQHVYFPNITTLATGIWAKSALQRADFGKNSKSTSLKIVAGTFQNATNLTELILRGTYYSGVGVIPLSGTTAFSGTPFANGGSGGTLYVPRALVSAYQSANLWSTILGYGGGQQNQVLALEDSPYATEPS